MLYRILALILLAPINAHAIECESESPLKVALGDKYYELVSDAALDTPANAALVKQVKKMLGDARFRSGHATRVVCKKVDGELTAVTHEYNLKEIEGRHTLRGDINVKLLIDEHKRRVIRTHTLSFPNDIDWQPGSASNELILNHRFRTRNNARGIGVGSFESAIGLNHKNVEKSSTMVEMDYALTVQARGIGVTQNIYTNGYLVEQSNWTLYKR